MRHWRLLRSGAITAADAQAISRPFDFGAVNYPLLAELLNRVSTKATNRPAPSKHPADCHLCGALYLHPLLATMPLRW